MENEISRWEAGMWKWEGCLKGDQQGEDILGLTLVLHNHCHWYTPCLDTGQLEAALLPKPVVTKFVRCDMSTTRLKFKQK